MSEILLEMKGMTKSFGGINVLNGVDFVLRKGEVHALVGENGAGKSTLMKILLGSYKRNSGEVIFLGEKVNFSSPAVALNNGISMIHQEISLIPQMDVAENIWFGREKKFQTIGLLNVKARYKKTDEFLMELGINIDSQAKIKDLSIAQMQLIEIARAVSYNPKIIIMDEPTSALTDNEIKLLYTLVNKLKKNEVSVIFISHKLDEVFEICDQITVLRDGALIATMPSADVTEDDLINFIVGRKVDKLYEKQPSKIGEVILEVKNLNRGKICQNVNLHVSKGEVFGLCGLMGAGRSEILRAIYGVDKKDSGDIYLEGRKVKINSPKQAVDFGLGMVTEDRLRMGVIYSMSVLGNTTLAVFRRITNKFGLCSNRKEKNIFSKAAEGLFIKYNSPKSMIGELSGGNQQKVVIGRWLLTNPKVLFLDEPTRGIDVGSKAEIYRLIDKLASEGLSIVMVSSELPEILALCDRIGVVYQGKIVFECKREEATQDLLIRHAFGIEENDNKRR